MNGKIILPIFFLILISLSVLAFAQEQSTIPTGPPTVPRDRPYEPDTSGVRQQQERTAGVLFIAAIIVSLLIGIFLMAIMIKNSPKVPNLIIHGLVFLGSAVWFVFMVFGLLSQLVRFGSIPDPDIIQIGWPSIFLLIFSGYLTYSLIKKQNFAEKMKYTLSLSSGGIIASVLAIIFMVVIGGIFNADGLGVALMGILIFTVGVIGSLILGIIGLFIDKSHKTSNK